MEKEESKAETGMPHAEHSLPSELPKQKKFERLVKTALRIEDRTKNWFRVLVVFIFRPVKLEYGRVFYWGGVITVLLIFLSLIVLCSPWMVRFIVENELPITFRNTLYENKDLLKTWTGFIAFLFELGIAFSIGGIFFTEPIVNKLKTSLAAIQQLQYEALTNAIPKGEKEMIELGDEIISLQRELVLAGASGMNIKEYFSKLYQQNKKLRLLFSRLYPAIPLLYLRFTLLKFIINFPGGLYGFTAFLLFVALSVVKVINIYLDSPWLRVTTST